MGKIYIASMKMRGKWAQKPAEAKVINVTSAQGKENPNRKAFSPMTEVEGGYKGYYCFENYWQGGKVKQGVDHKQSIKWWKAQKKGRRQYQKDKRTLYAVHSDGQKRNYIQSRKQVYVPQYLSLIKNKQQTEFWRKYVREGHDVVVFDFDGPKDENGEPICLEVTKEMLKQKINDPKHPFGHGYVVAAELGGIQINEYV